MQFTIEIDESQIDYEAVNAEILKQLEDSSVVERLTEGNLQKATQIFVRDKYGYKIECALKSENLEESCGSRYHDKIKEIVRDQIKEMILDQVKPLIEDVLKKDEKLIQTVMAETFYDTFVKVLTDVIQSNLITAKYEAGEIGANKAKDIISNALRCQGININTSNYY